MFDRVLNMSLVGDTQKIQCTKRIFLMINRAVNLGRKIKARVVNLGRAVNLGRKIKARAVNLGRKIK